MKLTVTNLAAGQNGHVLVTLNAADDEAKADVQNVVLSLPAAKAKSYYIGQTGTLTFKAD